MERKQGKVLIVDQDENLRDVLKLMFEDELEIVDVDTGEAAKSSLSTDSFDFVILDLQLPDMSGSELCKFIADKRAPARPNFIVMTELTSDKDIEGAYALGASDYIIKPFNVVAFHSRILQFNSDIEKINNLEQHDLQTQSLAKTAMKQSAAYGNGLELLARLNNCADEASLMQEVIKSLNGQGFHCAIELRTQFQNLYCDADYQPCSSNEMKVFELLRDKGRIYAFGKRCIFNDNHCSILVKNMPVTGTMSYDAILDLLAKLLPGISARFLSLCQNKMIMEAQASLIDAVETIKQNIIQMESERRKIVEDITSAINLSFHELEFTEKQEQFFINLIETTLNDNDTSDSFNQLNESIQAIVNNLGEVSQKATVEAPQSDDDIELF